MELRPGDRIDRYTLIRPLGEGGQGAVWQVVDPLDRGATRALKLVRLAEAGQAAFARARREAKILAALAHPGLCACHALFEDLDKGLVGVVLDLVQGAPLDEAMQDRRMSKGHKFAALVQVAEVLAHVHAGGLAHRDLKPANVLVTDAFWERPDQPGAVKLIDFGIAVPIGNPQRLTSVGGVIGTVRYLAPELFEPKHGAAAEESCARDMFAFGVIAWELLFGSHPAGLGHSASFEAMAQRYAEIKAGRRAWPSPRLSGAWAAAITTCLSLRQEDRPENGAALVTVLRTGRLPPPSRRAAAVSLPSRTETHTSAMGAPLGPTEPMVPVARTAPTEAPRIPQVVRHDKPASRSARGPLYALAGAIALLAGAIYVKPPKSISEGEVSPSPILLPSAPTTATALLPAPTHQPVRSDVCCGGPECDPSKRVVQGSWCEKKDDRCAQCASGRTYVAGRCAEKLARDRRVKLRLARVDRVAADATVCFGEPTNHVCLLNGEGVDRSASRWDCTSPGAKCLETTVSALMDSPGIPLTITHPLGGQIAQGRLIEPKGLLTSTLCVGVDFKVGEDRIPVFVYLDDP
ncbi:serine/threonine protein kinase [Polyangium sp. y55x31]|uniref:serine/threonine-protein kinase n=1 Tax=Polyangium sp. y55x31 TaxID=3042688 RepID=UPI00248309C9|nr:serine/threonine protein kinase [Polyangium sp. y55x31]MDI1476355.1 protein kinase [Polyangium sp. y55x31]